MTDPDFEALVETLTKPNELQEKKANFYAVVTGLTLCTWLLWIVPGTWAFYHWAF